MQCQLTKYYLAWQQDYPAGDAIPIKDINGAVLAQVEPHCFASFALEGSGRLANGTVVNVTGGWIPVDAHSAAILTDIARTLYRGKLPDVGLSPGGTHYLSFTRSNSPWGTAAYRSTNLAPFASCAVDPKVFPLGSKLFCPVLKDRQMPDGTTHMGYLWAHDTGGAIKGAHIDWFTGTRAWAKWAEQNVGDSVEVELISV